MHRSGVRQPAVVWEPRLQERLRKVAGNCRRCADERRCHRGSETTGGLRPPLLFRARLPAVVRQAHLQRHVCTQSRDDVARDARSGGRQPAVVWELRLQERLCKVAGDLRRCADERRKPAIIPVGRGCDRVRVTTGG